MLFEPHKIYHIYNQGNNHEKVFHQREDYLMFINFYKQFFSPLIETIAWCLMPNHFHFMIYTDEQCAARIRQGGILIDPITNSVRKLLSGYAHIFNNQNKRSGSLFRQKTKAKCLSDIRIKPNGNVLLQDYYVNCFHYIHQNPVVAKLVSKMEDWEFSSFRDYAGYRNGSLCNKALATKHCNYSPEDFIKISNDRVDKKMIAVFE